MKAELKTGSVNQIIEGDDIFTQGEEADCVALILKGKIHVHTEGVNLELGSGNFLGLCDIPDYVYRVTYTAKTNCAIYVFQSGINLGETIDNIFKANKEYAALMASAMNKYIRALGGIYYTMEEQIASAKKVIPATYQEYQNMCRVNGAEVEQIESASEESLKPNVHEDDVDVSQVKYYITCCNVDMPVQKAFYGASHVIAKYNILQQVALINRLIKVCTEDAQYLKSLMQPLMLSRRNLYHATMNLIKALQNIDVSDTESMELFDRILDQINNIESVLYDKASVDLKLDHGKMEKEYFILLNHGKPSADGDAPLDASELADESFAALEELDRAMDQILEVAELEEEQEKEFRKLIQEFIDLPDKGSTEDDARTLRRGIAKIYYDLYEKVFLYDYEQGGDSSPAIDFFLRYGYLSEDLLGEAQREDLLKFDRKAKNTGDLQVYDMKEWLTEIYEGRKEPSKSEFDQDFQEYLREQKKTKAITEEEMAELEKDVKAKVHYEIHNMFKTNHRIMGEQTATFVPFLYTDGCISALNRSFLSKEKVSSCVRRLRSIDFSVFYREIVFHSDIFKNNKDYIMEEVMPDIILMPGCGSKGSMWQELSGRKRNSKGRFLMPAFFEGDMETTMVDLFGRFRWELCRTMQGATWNNIQFKSLTSEYSDFVQFYRKNRDLSDDRKEKLKLQIQKCRNNTREVFVVDYRNWIKHESSGGMMLSKPVREIMATYCPFSKEIREGVSEQPMFKDAMARYNRENAKKQRELDLKFRVWEKDEVEVPPEVIATREFYRGM